MTHALVSARGLAKNYGDFVAVDSIDFDVEQGEAFGFLGPNGAGKSTTMRMIGCVSPMSSGTLQIFGLNAARLYDIDVEAVRCVPPEDKLGQIKAQYAHVADPSLRTYGPKTRREFMQMAFHGRPDPRSRA